MVTQYRRLAEVRRPRALRVVAGRPVADYAAAERRGFLERELRKPDHLIQRYDWRAWARDMRDAAITIVLFALALGIGEMLLEMAS